MLVLTGLWARAHHRAHVAFKIYFLDVSSAPVVLSSVQWYTCLLHIMCGYQCDKAMTKNDTREVI